MSYERDKEIFTRNKRVNIINKLDNYLSRTNCTSEEMDAIMDAADNMEIEKLEELEKYLDSAKKGALYDGSYIIEQIYDLMEIEKQSEEIDNSIELSDESVMDKLAKYLLKSDCTKEEINEVFELSDQIMHNDIDDLGKVEQFIDNAIKNEIYSVNYLRNIMKDIVTKYSDEIQKEIDQVRQEFEQTEEEFGEVNKEFEQVEQEFDELEDEEIEKVKKDKKGIKVWFKEKFSKKDKKIDTTESESLESTNTSIEVQVMNQVSLEVYVDEDKNNFIMNTSAKELGFITEDDLAKAKDGLFLLSDEELENLKNKSEIEIEYIDVKIKNGGKEDMESNKEVKVSEKEIELDENDLELEDEEIEEEVKRNRKGIKGWFKEKFSKKEKKEKKSNKIVTFFKTKFSKKDIELEDEEIDEVTERQKTKLFSKKDKKVKKVKEETKYEDLSIQDKLFKYLHGTGCTWKSLVDIVNKVAIISEDEEKAAKLNEFLNKNKDLDNDKKVAALIYENINILGKVENKKSSVKINPMCEQIKEFFAKNKLDENEEVINLYNEIIMNDDNIDKLYDYIINNMEEAKNAENIINEMNKILGKEVEKNDTIKLPEIKEIKAKRVPKTAVSATEPTVELPKETEIKKVEEVKTENRKEVSYDKYKKAQDELNDKLKELEYLKHEYNVLEKSIYGKALNDLSVEEKRDIMLIADSQKLMQLKEKLSEIKEVQQQIDKLSLRVGAYYMKYGVDVKAVYEEKYSQDYNEAVSQREREDKMDESLYLFNKFNDDEIAAIYKYMHYEKTLK